MRSSGDLVVLPTPHVSSNESDGLAGNRWVLSTLISGPGVPRHGDDPARAHHGRRGDVPGRSEGVAVITCGIKLTRDRGVVPVEDGRFSVEMRSSAATPSDTPTSVPSWSAGDGRTR